MKSTMEMKAGASINGNVVTEYACIGGFMYAEGLDVVIFRSIRNDELRLNTNNFTKSYFRKFAFYIPEKIKGGFPVVVHLIKTRGLEEHIISHVLYMDGTVKTTVSEPGWGIPLVHERNPKVTKAINDFVGKSLFNTVPATGGAESDTSSTSNVDTVPEMDDEADGFVHPKEGVVFLKSAAPYSKEESKPITAEVVEEAPRREMPKLGKLRAARKPRLSDVAAKNSSESFDDMKRNTLADIIESGCRGIKLSSVD